MTTLEGIYTKEGRCAHGSVKRHVCICVDMGVGINVKVCVCTCVFMWVCVPMEVYVHA